MNLLSPSAKPANSAGHDLMPGTPLHQGSAEWPLLTSDVLQNEAAISHMNQQLRPTASPRQAYQAQSREEN